MTVHFFTTGRKGPTPKSKPTNQDQDQEELPKLWDLQAYIRWLWLKKVARDPWLYSSDINTGSGTAR